MSVIRCRQQTVGRDFENDRFWRSRLKNWFSSRPEEHFRAFRRAAAQNQVTRRAEIGSFSASARRVISDQSRFSFQWLCPKFENLTTQIDFWRSFLLRLVVSRMFPNHIYIELCCGWVWPICQLSAAAERPRSEILKMSDFEDRGWKIDFPAAPRSILERFGALPRKIKWLVEQRLAASALRLEE